MSDFEVIIKKNRAGIEVYKPAQPEFNRLEKHEQIDLNHFSKRIFPEHYASMFHVINESGGMGSAKYGAQLNSQGRKKGVADWCVMVPSGGYHGLFIELKRCHSGSVSKEQKAFLLRQQALGYKCLIAHGYKAAIQATKDYFALQA